MEKQYASYAVSASDSPLVGNDAGQGGSPNRALASNPIAAEPADMAAVPELALTGGAFMFEPGWTSPAIDLAALSPEFSAGGYAVSGAPELASLLGEPNDRQIGSAEVPIWGLSSDDFSFI